MERTILKALNTAFILAVLGAGTVAHAQDEVDTRIGKLQLNQGLPTKDSAGTFVLLRIPL